MCIFHSVELTATNVFQPISSEILENKDGEEYE